VSTADESSDSQGTEHDDRDIDSPCDSRHNHAVLDYSFGDGDVRDRVPDDDVPTGQTKHETARTGFSLDDVDPSRRERWQRLSEINSGAYRSERGRELQKAGVQTVADTLDCSERVFERALHIVETTEIQDELGTHVSYEAVALGAVSLVADKHRSEYLDPTDAAERGVTSVTREDDFHELRNAWDVEGDDVRKVRERIRERL
jgi:hypothetical protein